MNYSTVHLKEIYGFLGEDGRDATLDIYVPYNSIIESVPNVKRPCVLVCPGGGYAHCSKREAEPIALNFLNDGYNTFVLTYSLAPHTFPAQITEVAAAVDYIHKNAEALSCDENKIIIIGFSAGGHLAAHYSTCYDCEEVRRVFPESYPVAATILAYPVISAVEKIAHMGSFYNLTGKSQITEEDAEKLSLQNKVSEKTPPTYIWHTAEDNCVPVFNSLRYAEALSENKIPYELHIFPYGPHGLSTADSLTCDNLDNKHSYCHSWMEEAKDWLKLILN